MQCKLISDRRLEWKLGLRILKQDKHVVLKSLSTHRTKSL